MEHDAQVRAYERQLRRAGLPSFLAERTAARDIWTRAVGLLALVVLVEVLGSVDLDLSAWANAGLVAAGLAVVLVALAAINVARRRPAMSGPEDIGVPELVAFVVVPALLPLVLNQQWVSALVTAGVNLAVLGVLYAVIGYGLLAVLVWAARRLVAQMASALTLIVKSLPLLLLFSVVLFINTEMWQTFSELSTVRIVVTLALLASLATLTFALRLPREVATIEAAVESAEGTPPLDRRERVNVGLVMLVAQGLQVLVVAAAVFLFFVGLGVTVISPALQETWIAQAPDTVLSLGDDVVVTVELLRVSIAIAGLSAFYYAIAVLTDATYREEFASELLTEMRESFETRARYRVLLARP